jgi:type III restriction enzyme
LPDFINELSTKTNTPIKFIIDVVNECDKDNIRNDIELAKKTLINLIKRSLADSIETIISYQNTDGIIELPQEFNAGETGKKQEKIKSFGLSNEWLYENNIVEYDSEFEKDIIIKDAKQSEITVFAKLPKLEINTPLGKYNPDFCYVLQKEKNKKIILVVETKGYELSKEIPIDEQAKIDFAKIYFNKLKETYKSELQIEFRTRIKKVDLESLIKEVMNGN